MRLGFAISVLGHAAAVLAALVYAGANPFDTAPADAITVDIVSPADVADAANKPEAHDNPFDIFSLALKSTSASAGTASAAPQANAPNTKTAQTASPPPPTTPQAAAPSADNGSRSEQQRAPSSAQKAAAQAPSPAQKADTQALGQAPQPVTQQAQALAGLVNPNFATEAAAAPAFGERESSSFADVFAMPITLPDGRVGGNFDASAYAAANIEAADRDAFRDHIKTCAKLPSTLAASDHVRVVLRVALKRDGTLASTPDLVEASGPPAKGLPLKEAAVRALRQCQPYSMLPRDKYDEWKVIDMTFTPQDLAG